ncbi:hypothetical protein HanRHA438_Chr15g0683121 [Helianthus annuus]|nr:hypothetical protein HanRHA438_Chr15g0683121 [Helianthus annuus]
MADLRINSTVYRLIRDLYLIASNRLKTTKLLAEIRQSDGMMKNSVSSVIIRVGPANDTNERKILTVGTSNVRLKSPGTEKTSETPICTRRRARWRPRVASAELNETAEDCMQVAPLIWEGQPMLPLGAAAASREPTLVSMILTE